MSKFMLLILAGSFNFAFASTTRDHVVGGRFLCGTDDPADSLIITFSNDGTSARYDVSDRQGRAPVAWNQDDSIGLARIPGHAVQLSSRGSVVLANGSSCTLN